MDTRTKLPVLALTLLAAAATPAFAQSQYIGYVYPAGGQQGTTFPIRLGGQRLTHPSEVIVTGEGVSVRLVEYYEVMGNQELGLLRQQLRELRKKKPQLSEAMVARMAYYEFPKVPEPPKRSGLVCPACGQLNPLTATVCDKCNASLDKAQVSGPAAGGTAKKAPKSDMERARQNLIKRIERRFAEDERQPAVRSHRELVFAEVTIAPDAKPGPREIRVVTKQGVSNAIPFCVGQVPEVARKPMKTAQKPVLGKEERAKRNRPAEEEQVHVKLPCTMNGQVASGEINRYRFEARKGQRLVISVKARELVPYIADGVPGWFQAVLKLHDADGKEVAYNDDYRFHPDPVILFEVPEDGEYVLGITDALFRGRESFLYRITIGELPFVTSIFPLGGRAGQPVKVETHGWHLDKARLAVPPKNAAPGRHLVAADNGRFTSNYMPFALGTLPECTDAESNDKPAKAQKVKLPVVVNGRADRPGDWDVFEVQGKAGQTLVAEVTARRLGSPYDSFVKVTDAAGKVIGLNDDHHDAASGRNTDHADSYLMVKLPADGKYYVHLGDTRRHAGKAYAYRLRISNPRPDFDLRVVPSRVCIRGKRSAALTVYAIRRDGFDGPIKLTFKDLPEGLESPGATVPAKKETTRIAVKSTVDVMEAAVNVTMLGTARIGGRDVVRQAVPAEDSMQAFLWRHLLPAEDLPLLVYDPSYRPPADRIRPPIQDKQRPKKMKRNLRKAQVDRYMREITGLYQRWFLTDDFANRQIATIEARLIK